MGTRVLFTCSTNQESLLEMACTAKRPAEMVAYVQDAE
jgi:hypothetical protein